MSNIGSDFTVGVIQLMFVGHIGTIEMSAAALGNSFCNVTGFSLNVGLLSAMDTLVSQAHGAKEMRKIGQVTNQSLLMLGLVTLLMCPVWMVCYTCIIKNSSSVYFIIFLVIWSNITIFRTTRRNY